LLQPKQHTMPMQPAERQRLENQPNQPMHGSDGTRFRLDARRWRMKVRANWDANSGAMWRAKYDMGSRRFRART
jgi:hypothetical protein